MRSLVLSVALLFGTAAAAQMEPVTVEQIRHARAALTVAGPNGEVTYSPADLEAFGTYGFSTKTPWRESEAAFVGARLTDILEASGLGDAQAIRVIAENDYTFTMDRSAWVDHTLLVATRVDGRPHSRRSRGPIQFVFPMDSDPSTGDLEFQGNWVWMASRIEAVD